MKNFLITLLFLSLPLKVQAGFPEGEDGFNIKMFPICSPLLSLKSKNISELIIIDEIGYFIYLIPVKLAIAELY